MKEIRMRYSNERHTLMIDSYKIILSQSFEKVQTLFKELLKGIDKESVSEYADEYSKSSLKINEVTVDSKRSISVLIHPWTDLSDASKIAAKSLFYKYLESSLDEIEMNDLFQTLMQVYEVVSDELICSQTVLQYKNAEFSYKLSPLTTKQIIKLVDLQIKKEDCYANYKDLNTKEVTFLLLSIIKESAIRLKELDFYVLFDCNDLDSETLYLFDSMPKNVCAIIYPHKVSVSLKKENIYIIGKSNVDLLSDEDIYENIMMNESDTSDLEAFKLEIDDIFANEYNDLYTNAIIKAI